MFGGTHRSTKEAPLPPHAAASSRTYGTNPMAFGFPRTSRRAGSGPGSESGSEAEAGVEGAGGGEKTPPSPPPPPLLWDQAAATMARGEISLAGQRGDVLPDGVAVDAGGRPTHDPEAALGGAQLTFGGAKGTCIAMMVELLAAGLTGAPLSFEAEAECSDDASATPTRNGQFIIAIDPDQMFFGDESGGCSEEHAEKLFRHLAGVPGTQLPSTGRHAGEDRMAVRARAEAEGVDVPVELFERVSVLAGAS